MNAGVHLGPVALGKQTVLVHADGGSCQGTPLEYGTCPKCGITPDRQSTEFWPMDSAEEVAPPKTKNESVEITFQGASDDLVEIGGQGVPGADEYNVNPADGIGYAGKWIVTSTLTGGAIVVHGFYDGTWFFAVSQIDDGIPIPDWPITVSTSDFNDYGTKTTIMAPRGSVVVKAESPQY